MFVATISDLLLGLREMNDDRRLIAPGQSSGFAQSWFGRRIDGMGRDSRVNQGIALPVSEEPFGIRKRLRNRFVVRGRKIEDGLAQNGAHAGLLSGSGDIVLE